MAIPSRTIAALGEGEKPDIAGNDAHQGCVLMNEVGGVIFALASTSAVAIGAYYGVRWLAG